MVGTIWTQCNLEKESNVMCRQFSLFSRQEGVIPAAHRGAEALNHPDEQTLGCGFMSEYRSRIYFITMEDESCKKLQCENGYMQRKCVRRCVCAAASRLEEM